MRPPARFGDRQWLHALGAVLAGLLLAGGPHSTAGRVVFASPLAAVADSVSRVGCALAAGAAAIMPLRGSSTG